MPPKNKSRHQGKVKGSNEVRVFAEGDLVFAEVKGYPPWPARVESDLLEPNKPGSFRYPVFFFGTCDRGKITASHLFPYRKYKNIYGVERQVKSKRLSDRFKEALEEISELAGGDDIAESELSENEESIRSESNSISEKKSLDSVSKKSSNEKSEEADISETSIKSPSSSKAIDNDPEEEEQEEAVAVESTKDSVSVQGEKVDEIEEEKQEEKEAEKETEKIEEVEEEKENTKDDEEDDNKDCDEIIKDSKSEPEEESVCEDKEEEDEEEELSTKGSVSIAEESMQESPSSSNSEVYNKYQKILDNILNNRERIKEKIQQKDEEKSRLKRLKLEEKIVTKKKNKVAEFKKSRKDLLDELIMIDSNIKGNLSIGKVNIEESLKAFDKFLLIELPLTGLVFYGEGLKPLLFTFKKCRKYKDDRVKDLSEKCYSKLMTTLNALSKRDIDKSN